MVGIDGHDVIVLGDGPIRPIQAVWAIMHGVFFAQALKEWPERVVAKTLTAAHVQR